MFSDCRQTSYLWTFSTTNFFPHVRQDCAVQTNSGRLAVSEKFSARSKTKGSSHTIGKKKVFLGIAGPLLCRGARGIVPLTPPPPPPSRRHCLQEILSPMTIFADSTASWSICVFKHNKCLVPPMVE